MDFQVSESAGGLLIARAELAPHLTPNWFDLNFWQTGGQPPESAPGRGQSYFLHWNGLGMVWRHYRRGGLAARISEDRYLWTGLKNSRLWKELVLTNTLFSQGLPVPRPLGGQIRRHGLAYSADILTERLPAARSLADLVAGAQTPDWRALGETLRRFHDAGLDHVDLNARNILLSNGRFCLIDFDRCRLRAPHRRWQQANLGRLMRSLAKLFPDRDWSPVAAQIRAGHAA